MAGAHGARLVVEEVRVGLLHRAVVDRLGDGALDGAHLGDHDLVAVLQGGARLGLDRVVAVDLDAELVQRAADGERRHLVLPLLLVAHLDGDRLRGDDLQVEALAPDGGAAAQRQLGAGVAQAELVQRTVDVLGGHPVGAVLAVHGQLQRPAVADRDAGLVVDRRVQPRRDHVVLVDGDALAGEHVTDGPAEGADLAGLPVDRDGHGLAHRGVPGGGGDQRDGDSCDEGDEDGPALGEECEFAPHGSPMVVRPGPRVAYAGAARSPGRTRATQHDGPHVHPATGLGGTCVWALAPPKASPLPANSHKTITGTAGQAK